MIPWFKLPKIARVDVESYMNDSGLTEVLSSLLRYGVAIVTGVSSNGLWQRSKKYVTLYKYCLLFVVAGGTDSIGNRKGDN